MNNLPIAIDFHRRGLSLIPVAAGSKQPLVRWKTYQQQPPAETQIVEWFTTWPSASIAAILGRTGNLFAVDVDGPEAHEALVKNLRVVPMAPMSMSGSGKPLRYHLFFTHPPVLTSAKITPWHPNLEFRGDKGLVILPPSLHSSGNCYTWADGRSLDNIPLSEVPPPLLAALEKVAQKKANHQQLAHTGRRGLHAIPRIEGISRATKTFLRGDYANGPRWNERLYAAACDLCGCGIPIDEATPLLLDGAMPWDATQAQIASRTIKSAYAASRLSSREYAALVPGAHQPTQVWTSGPFTINEVPHPARRHLPPPTSFHV